MTVSVSENVNLLQALLDSMPENIYFKDADGRFTRVSRSLARYLAVDDSESVIGKTDFDFYPHEDAAAYRRDETEIMRTGQPLVQKEERCIAPDGRTTWYMTTKIPIRDDGGAVVGIAGVSRDITARKATEAELRDSEERFRRVFQSDMVGIHFWDAAGNVTEANNVYLRMIGYTSEDLAARRVRWRDLTPPEYTPVDDQALHDLRTQGTCATFEKEYIRKDGRRIPVLVGATLLPHSQHEGVAYALDLTELKRAERALREQRQEQEVILDSVPAFIWYKDRENRIIRANAAAAAARGITKAQMEGRSTFELYPEYAEAYHQDDLEVIASGRPKMGIIEPLEATSGEERWLRTDKIPYRDESGEIIGVIVFATDITELKLAEDALRREQHLMNLLMEHMPDAIYFKDCEGRFMRANPAQARYLGVPRPEEALGRPDTDFFSAEAAAEYFADEQAVITTGQPLVGKIEHNGRSGDALRWFSTTKVPIRDTDGRIVGTAGISRDITRMKQTEEALRSEQQLMQILMDNMPDAIYFKDRDSRFLRTNIAHARIMGIENPLQAVGRRDAEFFRPEDAAQFLADEQSVIGGQSLVGRIEHHGGTTGEMRWWSTTKVPIHGAGGDIVGIAGITRDITAVKRAEEEIRQLNEELEQRVADRTAMLEAANRQLQAEIAERREAEHKVLIYQERLRSLASELSLAEERERRRIAVDLHDQIGQTLALIQIRLQTMRETTPQGSLAGELDACVELIRQPIRDIRSLVFNLSPPVLYDLGLEAAASWIVDQHRGRRGLRIAFEADEQTKPLDQAVSVLVFRAIRELLTNVVKHSNARSAKVWLRTEGQTLCVGVDDDGRGFDATNLGPHSDSAGGFGLFSIREQLERVGGTMKIESTAGGGSRIMLSVPLQAAQTAHEQKGLP